MKNLLTFSLLLIGSALMAQIKTPASSPSGKITQTVGLTEVTVEYNRPSAKGRIVFGDLVPYGKMWRTGANASTKIGFSEDVVVEGKALKAGTYALYTTPGESEWEIVFYKNTSFWGLPAEWKAEDEAARFKVKAVKLNDPVETMTIDIANISNEGAQIRLSWEKTLIPMNLTVSTDATVMKSIERVMNGPSAADYFAAGRYMFESGKDKNVALEYVQMANQQDAKFWTVRTEALILAELGRTREAIAAATRSRDLAHQAGNEDYVRMNEKSIAEWSKK